MRWCAVVTFLLVMHTSMLGQWSYDPKVGTPICTTSPSQIFPLVLSDSAGGAFIIWHSLTGTIETQRIDSLGTGHWGPQGRVVLQGVVTYQPLYMAVSNPTGALFIATARQWLWGGPNPFPPVQHIVMKLDADGHAMWPDSGVAISPYNPIPPPGKIVLHPDDEGGAFYAYVRYDSLYVGRIDSAGTLRWGQRGILIDDGTNNRIQDIALAADAEGGVYCVYSKWEYAGGSRGIGVFAQRIDSAGTQQWPPSVVVQSPILAVNSMNNVHAIADGRGGVVVATSGYDPIMGDSTFKQDIHAQRISATRQLFWGSAGRVVVHDSADQMLEALVTDGANGAYFIFTGKNVTSGRTDRDILVQRLDSTGLLVFNARGLTVCGNIAEQMQPTAASDGHGGILLSWEDRRNSTLSDSDIYAQRVDATGALFWGGVEGVPVSIAPNAQRRPSITTDGHDGAIVVWEDARNVSDIPDIYAARITASGVLLPVSFISLMASRYADAIEIAWSMVHPSSVIGFTIEGSEDGLRWETRGFTPARQTRETASYVYRDIASIGQSAINWYRIRIESIDGTTEHSPILRVDAHRSSHREPQIALYPEPVSTGQSLTIVLGDRSDEMVALRVHDILGREIPALRRDIRKEVSVLVLPLAGQVPIGSYFLTVSSSTGIATVSFRIIE